MTCPACGATNDPAASACAQCGRALSVWAAPAESAIPTSPAVPPTQPWPVYGPSVTRPPAPPRGLATAVVVMLSVIVGVAVFYAIGAVVRVRAIDQYLDEPNSADNFDALGTSDTLLAVAAVFYNLAFLAAIVLFVIWLWRIRENAVFFQPDGQRRHRLWVVFGWFTPIAWWWFPYQLVADSWESSTPVGQNHRKGIGLVLAWWFLYWAAIPTARATWGLSDSLDNLRTQAIVSVWVTPVDVAAAVLAILVVRRLTARQSSRSADSTPPATARHAASGF